MRKTADARTHEFDVQDVEYLRHGDKPLLAQASTSRAATGRSRRWSICTAAPGASPTATPTRSATRCWPATASSWSRSTGAPANEGAYPKALPDINYAIRWVKPHAKELKTEPDLVGISGQSSGGHLAMLAAMRPHDPRYTSDPAAGRLARARRHGEGRRACRGR